MNSIRRISITSVSGWPATLNRQDNLACQIVTFHLVTEYSGERVKKLSGLSVGTLSNQGVLLFGEADALFGKRAGIRTTYHRYANQDISLLPQSFGDLAGKVFLTSNLHTRVDGAFVRRFRLIQGLPMPARAEQQQIWHNAFAPACCCRTAFKRRPRPFISARSARNQISFNRIGSQQRSIMQVQLAHDIGPVLFHGFNADA